MTSLKDVIRLNLRSIIGIANYPRSMYVLGGCLEKGNGFCNVTATWECSCLRYSRSWIN